MQEHGPAAEKIRPLSAKQRAAKPSGSGKRSSGKAARVQFHLGESTVRRLGVHAALEGKNASKIVDEILTSWLTRFGKGRELFPATGPADSTDEVEPAL